MKTSKSGLNKNPIPAKTTSPIVSEFQSICKAKSFSDQEVITSFSNLLEKMDTQFKLINQVIPPKLYEILLRFFQKYKFQHIIFYSCPLLDANFIKQLATDFHKYNTSSLSLDYCPIDRDSIIPFFSAPTLHYLSLRGNQCITLYDFKDPKKQPAPFSPSFNNFCKAISTSTLEVLNLYGCHIGDVGAQALANCLYLNTFLRVLCLSKNNIGDQGAIALSEVFSYYTLNSEENEVIGKLFEDEAKASLQRAADECGGLSKKRKGQKSTVKKPPQGKVSTKKSQFLGKFIVTEKKINFDPDAPIKAPLVTKWHSCKEKTPGNPSDGYIFPGNTSLTVLTLDENHITEIGANALKKMLDYENCHIVGFSIRENPEINTVTINNLTRTIPKPE